MFYIRPRKRWTLHPHATLTHTDWRNRSIDEYVHHTADAGPKRGRKATVRNEIEYLRSIEAFHIHTRGYRAGAYSYMIMPSGRVWEVRGFEIVGAHTLDPKDADNDGILVENHDLGVCFAGNFNLQKPTRRALAAHTALRARLKMRGVRIDQMIPHRAAFATSCPGDNLVKALKL